MRFRSRWVGAPRSRAPRSAALAASALSALLAASLATPARADRVEGTRSALLREQTHFIDIRLDRGSATLTVRRTVWNGGARHDQAIFWIDVPERAVATGLRTLGVKDGAPFWFAGELMEAEAAAAKYRELTGIGGYYPKDPALLSWRHPQLLALQVFPCAPKQPKTIEYTLEMPTTYREGAHHLALSRVGTESLPAMAVVSAVRPGDTLLIGGRRVAPGTSLRLDRDELDLALAPAAPAPIEGALAAVPLSKDRHLVRVRFDAAARLSEVPRGAGVVVILDGSRSIDQGAAAAEVAAARAYLSHFKDARVEVLAFDREVRALHGRLVAPARAIATLAGLTLERRNGSRLDDALARADALLGSLPRSAPRRVVLLTDLLTRSALSPAQLQGKLRSGAILHIGVVGEGTPALQRDDDDPWAAVARGTGGVLWRGQASVERSDAAGMARIYEELARPLRVHGARLIAGGLAAEDLTPLPEILDEGVGYGHLAVHATAPSRIELAGELWSTPIRHALSPDDAEARRWSALVFGSDLLPELRESELMPLAMRGRAVSPVTSYLAIEPGVRPSTEGLDWATGTGQGFGTGHGRLGGSHRARPPRISMFDHHAYLRDALQAGWKACGGPPRSASVTLETTFVEVVDVPVARVGGGPDPRLEQCLAEAVWALSLPPAFASTWARWEVAL